MALEPTWLHSPRLPQGPQLSCCCLSVARELSSATWHPPQVGQGLTLLRERWRSHPVQVTLAVQEVQVLCCQPMAARRLEAHVVISSRLPVVAGPQMLRVLPHRRAETVVVGVSGVPRVAGPQRPQVRRALRPQLHDWLTQTDQRCRRVWTMHRASSAVCWCRCERQNPARVVWVQTCPWQRRPTA